MMAMLNHWSNFILLQPAQRLALPAAGAGVDSVLEQEKLEARKLPEMAQNPQRPVHALLGMGLEDSPLYAVKPDTIEPN